MSETVNEPMVARSGHLKPPRYHYFAKHRKVNEKAIKVVGRKTDVTESVERIVEQEICAFLHYLAEEHGLELLDPNPVTGSDGEKYLYGLAEKTGRVYVNDVVADWRVS